jgi:hypothetical protein
MLNKTEAVTPPPFVIEKFANNIGFFAVGDKLL